MVKHHRLPQKYHPKASTGVFRNASPQKLTEVQSFKRAQNPTGTNPMENMVGDSFSSLPMG
jgi:hypothetical protein